ncbi:MAG TPA: rhomboid family intramembrane serine protease [Verrucomicrobiae bacterium]
MLEDRDYMRQPEYDDGWRQGFRFRWSWTMTLLAAYLVMHIVQEVAARYLPGSNLFTSHVLVSTSPGRESVEVHPAILALSPAGILHGYIWQLLTYQFLHGGWIHLLFNSVAILSFGSHMERMIGARRYLALVFASGIVGGIVQVLVGFAWPTYFGGDVVGASACAFGLVAGFAVLHPDERIFIFPIPFPIRAQTMLIGSAVVAIMLIIFPITNIANAAHLGGMAFGWFYVRRILSHGWHPGWGDEPALAAPAQETWPAAEGSNTEFLEDEVDTILDKISAKGIQSLTSRERDILEKARARMVKR